MAMTSERVRSIARRCYRRSLVPYYRAVFTYTRGITRRRLATTVVRYSQAQRVTRAGTTPLSPIALVRTILTQYRDAPHRSPSARSSFKRARGRTSARERK